MACREVFAGKKELTGHGRERRRRSLRHGISVVQDNLHERDRFGILYGEIDDRESAYDGMSPDDYAEQYGYDCDNISGAFLASCDAKLAELGSAP